MSATGDGTWKIDACLGLAFAVSQRLPESFLCTFCSLKESWDEKVV